MQTEREQQIKELQDKTFEKIQNADPDFIHPVFVL